MEDAPPYFAAPNEQVPQKATEIFSGAPPGTYVSVGTERGFLGAACSPKAAHLLLTDSDPGAARYNRINTSLLRIARDRKEYLRLRLSAGKADWAKAGLDPEAWDWWRSTMDFKPSRWNPWSFLRQTSFAQFHTPPERKKGPYKTFEGVNYLFSDPLFARLSAMAKGGNISVLRADLSDPYDLAEAAKKIGSMGPISVLDLSNIWYQWHMKNRDFARVLETFDRLAMPESLLLITSRMPLLSPNWMLERWRYGTLIAWNYHAFTFSRLRSEPSFLAFARSLKWCWLTRRTTSFSS